MPDNLNDRGPQDRSRISLSEQWEIDYWTMEFGCSEAELRKAVDEAGNSADEVREYLSSR
jgi:hypothetical protein